MEAPLPAEHAARAGAGAVGFFGAVLEHGAKQVEVLFHGDWGLGAGDWCSVGARRDLHSQARPIAINGRLSPCPLVSQPKAGSPICVSDRKTVVSGTSVSGSVALVGVVIITKNMTMKIEVTSQVQSIQLDNK